MWTEMKVPMSLAATYEWTLREDPCACLAPNRPSTETDGRKLTKVDARDLARELSLRTRPRADAKNVDLIVYATSCTVCIDREPLAHALLGLLENAIEATRRGFPVVMDVREDTNGGLLWHIQDSGDGSDDLGATAGHARSVVESHGGVLHVESAPGVGTTVSLWLPSPSPLSPVFDG